MITYRVSHNISTFWTCLNEGDTQYVGHPVIVLMYQDVGGASGDQMSVAALAGLYMMLIAGIAFAAIIAICEFTWRKRKLAVDENVSIKLTNTLFMSQILLLYCVFLQNTKYYWNWIHTLALYSIQILSLINFQKRVFLSRKNSLFY